MVAAFKWSISDWHELVDSGVLAQHRVELLEGEIIVRWSDGWSRPTSLCDGEALQGLTASLANPQSGLSPEGPMHSSTNHSVVEYFRELLGKRAVIREAHAITLDNSEPEPDIAVVRSPYNDYFSRHPYAKDIYWLVEISNKTLKLDLERKLATYARNGIIEYWVIDLVNKKLVVHTQPVGNSYTQIQNLTTGNISPQAFPDLAIRVDRMLLF